MKTTFGYGESKKPYAYITKNKKRLKQYDKVVYLNDKDEFEIEMFNPTNNKVLAEIELNGKILKSGIVLRPGERVFLERYPDVPKKFMFDTYEVNGNDKESVKAIENNGSLKVFFKNEKTYNFGGYSDNIIWHCGKSYNVPKIYDPLTPINNITCSRTTDAYYSNSYYLNTSTNYGEDFAFASLGDNNQVETGRIEMGDNSNQEMINDDSKFEYFTFSSSEWKILPMSRKNITTDDIVTYCSSCGRRKREKERFCPSCGHKF